MLHQGWELTAGEFRQTSPTSEHLIPPSSGTAGYILPLLILLTHLQNNGLLTIVDFQLAMESLLSTKFARMLTFSGGSDVEVGNMPGHVNVPC